MEAVAISDSFMDAWESLGLKEKAKTAEFVARLRRNPRDPRIRLERLKCADGDFFSAAVSPTYRAILCQSNGGWLLLHVDRHDPAYRWAERRRVEDGNYQVGVRLVEVSTTKVAVVEEESPEEPDDGHCEDDLVELSMEIESICGSWVQTELILELTEKYRIGG